MTTNEETLAQLRPEATTTRQLVETLSAGQGESEGFTLPIPEFFSALMIAIGQLEGRIIELEKAHGTE